MTADAPIGSGVELVQILRLLAEVEVLAGFAHLIVALDGGDGGFHGQAKLLGQLFDGVGTEGVDELGEYADVERRILFLQVALHDELRNSALGVFHVVVVIDLAIPAGTPPSVYSM